MKRNGMHVRLIVRSRYLSSGGRLYHYIKMWKTQEECMKKKVASILAAIMVISMAAACSAKNDSDSTIKTHNKAVQANAAAAVGDDYYYAETTAAAYSEEAEYVAFEDYDSMDVDFNYNEPTEADYDSNDNSGVEGDPSQDSPSGQGDNKVDISKEMLVYRCQITMDTLEFDATLASLKNKISEYHGFVERESQTDGSRGNGRYAISEDEKDYYYIATIRIPSEYYESFVASTEGLGILRSKNSSVDNVATRYGTLKNELEIYQAEYDRYLKQYNETEDEKIALQIQKELRNLSLTISDLKTEMSMLESDVAYSYVTITIHKVSEKDLEKEKELEEQKEKERKEKEEREKEKEKEDNFGTRVKKASKDSWKEFLAFLEGILMFFIARWWGIVLFLIIAGIVLLITKIVRKKIKKRNEIRREKREALEAQHRAQVEELKKEEEKAREEAKANNQAQIKARIQAQKEAAEKVKKDLETEKKDDASDEKKEDEKPSEPEKETDGKDPDAN